MILAFLSVYELHISTNDYKWLTRQAVTKGQAAEASIDCSHDSFLGKILNHQYQPSLNYCYLPLLTMIVVSYHDFTMILSQISPLLTITIATSL